MLYTMGAPDVLLGQFYKKNTELITGSVFTR